MIKPIGKQRVADEIVAQLRSLILTGKYEPGAKLPPERDLAKQLGVNRASLREALKKLEHLGLVKIRQGDGTRVENFMETAGIELISHLVPLAATYPDIVIDVLELRRLFGQNVARLAAERRTDADLERLRAIAARVDGREPDGEELLDADFEFWVAATAATQNRAMSLLVNTVRTAVNSYGQMLVHLTGSAEEIRAHHREMIAAFEAKQPDRAAAEAERHMVQGSERVAPFLDSLRALAR